MCFTAMQNAIGRGGFKVPQPLNPIGPVSASNIVGVTLDSLASNGQRLLKLPSASQFPRISGISLVDPTGQVK